MTGWNLPPGCNENDIPGNRDIDMAWDWYFDNKVEELWMEYKADNMVPEPDMSGDTAYDEVPGFATFFEKKFDDYYYSGEPEGWEEQWEREN